MTPTRFTRLQQFEYSLAQAQNSGQSVDVKYAATVRAQAEKQGRADVIRVLDQVQGKSTLTKTRSTSGYAKRVVSFKPGQQADFNRQNPGVVLGRFEGSGEVSGSLDVLSLGKGGSIVLELGKEAFKGIVIAGNSFKSGGQIANPEPCKVDVSTDGQSWKRVGIAGFQPVYANSINKIDPRSKQAGGDRFNFAEAGIAEGTPIKFVRVTDSGANFDLDAVYGF